jgi:hypothetical protein
MTKIKPAARTTICAGIRTSFPTMESNTLNGSGGGDIVRNDWYFRESLSAIRKSLNIADKWMLEGRVDLFEKFLGHFHGKGMPV